MVLRRVYFLEFIWVFFAAAFFLMPNSAKAEDYPIFDGRIYNGKFYPRIDIIEWGDPTRTHMEFHVYSKNKPVNMSFQLERKDGKVVMLVDYVLTERNEHVCRRVLAPGHFLDGFMVYTDTSDKDFDNVLVTMDPLPSKPGQVIVQNGKYSGCTLDTKERMPAGQEQQGGDMGNIAPGQVDHTPTKAVNGAIKGKGASVPFSDW